MHTTTLSFLSLISVLVIACGACADAPSSPSPDAEMSPPPLEPSGRYEVRSRFSLSAPPAAVSGALAELAAATDGPDDPSRFLIDRLVARLPEGYAQDLAAVLAPYVAAYVQQRIDAFAPELAAGARALTDGLHDVAHRFGTTSELVIDENGRARHTVTGLAFGELDVPFATLGLPDITIETRAVLVGEQVRLSEHAAAFPYADMLRVGLSRAVVPRVVPGATDLDGALHALVDCEALGGHIADCVGIGSPDMYAAACGLALTRLASEIDARLVGTPDYLAIAGSARAIDLDRDGPVEVLAGGTWTGTLAGVPLGASTFEGAAP